MRNLSQAVVDVPKLERWPEPGDGQILLGKLEGIVSRFGVLPQWAAGGLALWVLHTFAFLLRGVSTYLGIESPEKRCGKTTLLGVLGKLVNRPVHHHPHASQDAQGEM